MVRAKYIGRECEHCGKSFEASRYDAKFCSATCRVQNHRADNLYKRLYANALNMINEASYKHTEISENMNKEAIAWLAAFMAKSGVNCGDRWGD